MPQVSNISDVNAKKKNKKERKKNGDQYAKRSVKLGTNNAKKRFIYSKFFILNYSLSIDA